MTNLQS